MITGLGCTIRRWDGGIPDPLSEVNRRWSPYRYAYDNVSSNLQCWFFGK